MPKVQSPKASANPATTARQAAKQITKQPATAKIEGLLKCFDYIKHYHADMLESIALILEFFYLKRQASEQMRELIAKAKKRKPIYDECEQILKNAFQNLYVPLNPNANLLKILKNIDDEGRALSNHDIEEFLHIITQKKTTHRLFAYSTPLEVNELLVGLLDLGEGESVYNPCYGIGSLFFALSSRAKSFHLYGEELESSLWAIAQMICKILSLNPAQLRLNNILKSATFKSQKFDKIICNPPLDSHISVQILKDDERFATYESLIKSYPELLFLIHSLSHLKHKGVFILRTQTLLKSSLEGRLREKLCEEGLIEAIIELPKNIFPHQNYDFSIIVLSKSPAKNGAILHINAASEHFYHKDGKYNRLINLSEILALYQSKQISQYSTLTPLASINPHDLRVAHYIHKPAPQKGEYMPLHSLGVSIFRGQRVHGSNKDEKISYFDLGIADFSEFGFSDEFSTQRLKGEVSKIKKYKLLPYDIAISIRGASPKLTILSPSIEDKIVIANAGIIILRASKPSQAIALYCYLFSLQGTQALCALYDRTLGSLSPAQLENLPLPKGFEANASETFGHITRLASQQKSIDSELATIKNIRYGEAR